MTDEIEVADDTRIERHIWRNIGKKNARQMAQELGVSPDDILRVKMTLVDSIDELTLQVQRAKLLSTLQELADDAQERAANTDDRNYAGMVNSATASIKTLLTELNRASKADDGRVAELNRKRVAAIVQLMQATVEKGVATLSGQYQLDEFEVFQIFNSALRDAAQELQGDIE